MENLALRSDVPKMLKRRTALRLPVCPPIQVEMAATKHARICIVREDVLEGGTKQRAAAPYLAHKIKNGARNFVYASPFAGFAQVALAQAARACGAKLQLFCEALPASFSNGSTRSELRSHEFTKLAESFGANVRLFPTLDLAKAAASEFERMNEEYLQVPLGLDDPVFRTLMRTSLSAEWNWLKSTSNLPVRNLWVSFGSGTLAGILAEIVGPSTKVIAVDVGVLEKNDKRISRIRNLSNVEYVRLEMPFAAKAGSLPPCPSNLHYDAKLWELINENAAQYDVWWNVAR